MDNALDLYWQIPPVTRTFTTSILAISLVVHTHLAPFYWFSFFPEVLLRYPPQIWRLYTSFCISGPAFGILFDTYFVYKYMTELEVGNPRFPRKEDLVWYLVFVSAVIMLLCNTVISQFFPVYSYLQALIIALVYTATQDQRGQKASFYIITIPAQLVPYTMLLINLIYPQGIYTMIMQSTGIVAAHLYDFLSRLFPQFGGGGVNLIPTPPVLTRIGALIPSVPSAAGADRGRGPLPDSWRTRGTGRRLG